MKKVKFLKRRYIAYSFVILLVSILAIGGNINVNVDNPFSPNGLKIGNFITVTIGTDQAYAAGTPDYTCDGVDDDVQFQAAMNALPAGGGELEVLGGTYVFANLTSVTRAIDNVTITGVGRGTYFTGDAVTALFICGGNYWKFQNIRTDAGSITTGATTGWQMINVDLNGTLYSYADPSNSIVGGLMTVTALTTGGKLTAGANEVEGSNFDINGGTADGITLGSAVQVVITDADMNGGTINDTDITIDAGDTINTTGGTLTSGTNQDVGESKKGGVAHVYPSSGGTFKITASDATNGRYLCTGVNDEVTIATAGAAVPDGTVIVHTGEYNIDADLNIAGFYVIGDRPPAFNFWDDSSGPVWNVAADKNIKIGSKGALRNIGLEVAAATSEAAVEVTGAQGVSWRNVQGLLENVWIYTDCTFTVNSVGLSLLPVSGGGSDGIIQGCSFNNVVIQGFETGLYMYPDATAGDNSWISGNSFSNLKIDSSKYLIHGDGTDGNGVSDNKFTGVFLQPAPAGTPTHGFIELEGCSYNHFTDTMVWDWSAVHAACYVADFDSTCYYNRLEGYLAGIEDAPITDAGLYNTFLDVGVLSDSSVYKGNPVNLISNDHGQLGNKLYWDDNGSLEIETTTTLFDGFALKLTEAGAWEYMQQDVFPLDDSFPGKTFSCGVWLYMPSANTEDEIRIQLYDGTNSAVYDPAAGDYDDDWHWYTIEGFEMASGENNLWLIIRANMANSQPGDYVIVGAAMMVEGPYCPAYRPRPAPENPGYASGELAYGGAGTIAFHWLNPTGYNIFITKCVIRITTADADAANLDVGTANDAAGAGIGTEFFNMIPCENTDTWDSYDFAGTGEGQQEEWVICSDTGNDSFVVGKYFDNDATSVRGTWHIEYQIADTL